MPLEPEFPANDSQLVALLTAISHVTESPGQCNRWFFSERGDTVVVERMVSDSEDGGQVLQVMAFRDVHHARRWCLRALAHFTLHKCLLAPLAVAPDGENTFELMRRLSTLNAESIKLTELVHETGERETPEWAELRELGDDQEWRLIAKVDPDVFAR